MATKIWKTAAAGNTGSLATSGNYIGGSPAAGDNLYFPAGSANVTAGYTALNTSTLSGGLANVIFQEGYAGTVGDSSNNMQFTCSRLDFNGSGVAYLDLEASTCSPTIYGTASAVTGTRGLYLIGSALTTLDVISGFVGIASRAGETSTVATIRSIGTAADVWIGSGTSLTSLLVEQSSSVKCRCAATTIKVYAGTATTEEVGAITTLSVYGGTVYPNATGTITTVNAFGGLIDALKNAASRTWTTLNQDPQPGVTSVVQYDPAIVTVTNLGAPTLPQRRTVSQAA
jgi:hypothetical protein